MLPLLAYLTLTRVVFEYTTKKNSNSDLKNLTLTSVVFECHFCLGLFYRDTNLTLTSVVFESITIYMSCKLCTFNFNKCCI